MFGVVGDCCMKGKLWLNIFDSVSFLADLLWRVLLVVTTIGVWNDKGLFLSSSWDYFLVVVLGVFWVFYPMYKRLKKYLEFEELKSVLEEKR